MHLLLVASRLLSLVSCGGSTRTSSRRDSAGKSNSTSETSKKSSSLNSAFDSRLDQKRNWSSFSNSSSTTKTTHKLAIGRSTTTTSQSSTAATSQTSTIRSDSATAVTQTSRSTAELAKPTELSAVLSRIWPKTIDPECANALSSSLEGLATSSCSQTTVNIVLNYLGGINMIDSSSLLGNLPQMCSSSCQSGLEKLLQILKNPYQCANQVISYSSLLEGGGNGLLGSKAADILLLFSNLICVKDPKDSVKFCLNYPDTSAYFSQALSSKTNRSVQDTLLDLAVNRTDITCSACGIAQQSAIVRLDPIKNITSQDVKYGVVAGIAKIQESCTLMGLPKQQVASSSLPIFERFGHFQAILASYSLILALL